jgi:TRAP-type mannitol/chloroaromatic compound transport system substrate-binding protein
MGANPLRDTVASWRGAVQSHITNRHLALLWFAALSISACSERATETDRSLRAQSKVKLRVASEFQTNMPVLGATITRLASRLKMASDGMISMNIDEPGENVPKLESLGAVSEGKVDASYSASGYWAGKIPAAPLFSSVPYGPEASEYLAWMYQGNGMKLYQKMYDRSGYHVKVLICAIIPPETSGWFAQPINSVADLRGLNMRFYGLGGRVMEKLGVAVTMLSSAEIFQALERGRIDATEYSLPTIDQKLGFHSIVKYNYFPGWHQQATIAELLINKMVWDDLVPSQQMLIELACADSIVHSLAEGEGTQFQAMRDNQDKYGVTNKYWSQEMLDQFRTKWEEVAVEQCAQDPFFKEVYEDLQKFRTNYDLWEKNAFLPRVPRE